MVILVGSTVVPFIYALSHESSSSSHTYAPNCLRCAFVIHCVPTPTQACGHSGPGMGLPANRAHCAAHGPMVMHAHTRSRTKHVVHYIFYSRRRSPFFECIFLHCQHFAALRLPLAVFCFQFLVFSLQLL